MRVAREEVRIPWGERGEGEGGERKGQGKEGEVEAEG